MDKSPICSLRKLIKRSKQNIVCKSEAKLRERAGQAGKQTEVNKQASRLKRPNKSNERSERKNLVHYAQTKQSKAKKLSKLSKILRETSVRATKPSEAEQNT